MPPLPDFQAVTGGVLNTKVVDVVNGAFSVTGGQVDLTTLTVAKDGTATLGIRDEKKDVAKVADLTNAGEVTLNKAEAQKITNSNKVTLDAGAKVGSLTNKKGGEVSVEGDAEIGKLTSLNFA